jgi:Uma2 family endonuclease
MTQTQSKPVALEEFLKLAETKPASEFIAGAIVQKPMPRGRHSQLQLKTCNVINEVAASPKIAYALPELRCTFGNRSIVPDVAVFSWERIPLTATGEIPDDFLIPPDWMIEILSPEQSPIKVINNILYAISHGTRLGWLLAPDDLSILAFLPGQAPRILQGSDLLPVLPEISLELTADMVFGWLRVNS